MTSKDLEKKAKSLRFPAPWRRSEATITTPLLLVITAIAALNLSASGLGKIVMIVSNATGLPVLTTYAVFIVIAGILVAYVCDIIRFNGQKEE